MKPKKLPILPLPFLHILDLPKTQEKPKEPINVTPPKKSLPPKKSSS